MTLSLMLKRRLDYAIEDSEFWLSKYYFNPEWLSPVQTDATLVANNSQHCWMLHVASVCTPGCMLLGVVASVCTHCQHERNNSQHCWPNNVGTCCVSLHEDLIARQRTGYEVG